MEELRAELERAVGEVHGAGKHGMEEFRPELERVAAGIHWAGKKWDGGVSSRIRAGRWRN